MKNYTVTSGDTLFALAQRFYGNGFMYPIIAAANGLPDPDHIEVGEVLIIPDAPRNDPGARVYTVVAGDTLSALSRRFYGNGRLFLIIAAANGLPDPDHIDVGQVLVIPAVTAVYVVVAGDTLFAIARKFYGDGNKYGVLAAFNGIANPDHIEVGQVIGIPGGVQRPVRPRSPVSELRRAADAAEVELDRLDVLANTNTALGAQFGAARDAARQRLDAARTALAQAVAAEPPLWAGDRVVPAVLAPVRLEVRYRPNEQHPDDEPALAIRVVPDDLAVHTFEPELTDAEHLAAQQYWKAVSAVEVTERDTAAAWTTILRQLGAARAAWAVEVMRPQLDAAGAPTFPDVGHRDSTWTRAATSLLLPDRFIFRGWRAGKLVFEVTGADIPAGLAIGPDPVELDDSQASILGWSKSSAWMVDFGAAVRVGMGVLVPLTGTDVGFDQIVVLGISDRDPDTAGADLARSLQGQLYTRGLAFPPLGAPTNNTPSARASWTSAPVMRTPQQVDAAVGAHQPGSGQPAVLLGNALGLAESTAPGVPGRRDLLAAQGATERDDETAVARAIQGLGNYVQITHGDGVASDAILGWLTTPEDVTWFRDFVRPRGPLPALRIGRQPYGVLPVTPLSLWAPADGEPVPQTLLTRLRLLHGFVGRLLPMSPRVGRGPDQDDVLLGLLRRLPESVRILNGSVAANMPHGEPQLFGSTFSKMWWQIDGFTTLAAHGTPPLVELADMGSSALRYVNEFEVAIELVDKLSEVENLPNPPVQPAWLTWLNSLDEEGRRNIGFFWSHAIEIAGQSLFAGILGLALKRELELKPNPTADDLKQIADITAGMPVLKGFLTDVQALTDWANADQGVVDRHLAAVVEGLTTRVDAWATSLASARLRTVRTASPAGVRIGAYGWLVDVEPTAPDVRKADAGWVLTPSMQHAATAAVLHSGWAAHSHPDAFAVDLTSDRVRRAQATLSSIREGRTLEELLGYQLERALHEAQADDLIAPLREAFPLPPADPALGGAGAAEQSRAEHGRRLVLDGDAARRGGAAFIASARLLPVVDGKIVFGPRVQVPLARLDLLPSLLAQLDDTVDGLGDVLLAESVHHLVGGSPLRAGLAADTVGRANPAPEHLDVISTPRSHVTVSHSVAIAVAVGGPSAWSRTPRSALDPAAERLAAWALGEPGDWRVVVTPAAGAPDVSTLADVGAAAVDVVVEAAAPADSSALAARIRHRRQVDGTVTVTRADGLGGAAALSTLAGAVRALLGRLRPAVTPTAALHPQAPVPTADLNGLVDRVGTWWSAVQGALAAWPGGSADEQAAAIVDLAGIGLAGIRFDTPAAAGAAVAQRWTDVTLSSGAPPGGEPAATPWLNNLRDAVAAASGGWFSGAPFWTPGADGWASLGGEVPTGDPVGEDDIEDWLFEHRQVCTGVARLADAVAASGAVGGGVPAWLARQDRPAVNGVPFVGWVARDHPGARSAAHLAALRLGDPAGSSCALLVVDEWLDTIPAAPRRNDIPEQTAGLGFRFDRPDARAPQALLVVTPPDLDRGWCLEDLHAAVDETLWWTQARPLDGEDLPELRWVLG